MVVSFCGMSTTATPVGSPQEISENLKELPPSSAEVGSKKAHLLFYLVLSRQMGAVDFSPNWCFQISSNLFRFHCFNVPFLTNTGQQEVKHYNQKTCSIMTKLTGMSQDSVSYAMAINKDQQYSDRC